MKECPAGLPASTFFGILTKSPICTTDCQLLVAGSVTHAEAEPDSGAVGGTTKPLAGSGTTVNWLAFVSCPPVAVEIVSQNGAPTATETAHTKPVQLSDAHDDPI